MVGGEVAVLREPVVDHRMREQPAVGQHGCRIGISRHQHDGRAQAWQHRRLECGQVIGLHMHHGAARDRLRKSGDESHRQLRPAGIFNIAAVINYNIGTLTDRLGVDVVEGEV